MEERYLELYRLAEALYAAHRQWKSLRDEGAPQRAIAEAKARAKELDRELAEKMDGVGFVRCTGNGLYLERKPGEFKVRVRPPITRRRTSRKQRHIRAYMDSKRKRGTG